MSSRFSSRVSTRFVALTAAGVLALTIGACGRQAVEFRPDGAWPDEAEAVTVFRTSPVSGGVMVGGRSLVVSDGGIWEYQASALRRRAMFARGYRIGQPFSRGSDPALGGPARLGSKLLLVRPHARDSSNGEGVIESEEYEELVLANPENPARVERVTAVTGSIDSVRAYQSPDGVTQLLLVNLRREDDPGPALVLFSRQRGGWKQIWSSFGSPDGAQIIPVCYGFSTEAGSGQAFVHMLYAAGDSLDEPLRAIRLDARGKTHSVTLPKRELSRADDYLYLGERIRESGLGYSYSVQSKGGANGLLLVEDGGKSIRVISTDRYEPLTTVVDSEGALGIVAMSEADGGQVRVFDADSGESVAVTRMSHARGAIPLTGHGKWTAGAALIGTAGTSHTTLWSVYTLRGERIAGPWRSTQVVRDWSTPSWPYFGIQSMDELPASDGQALVLGLSIEHEAAIATVRIPQ